MEMNLRSILVIVKSGAAGLTAQREKTISAKINPLRLQLNPNLLYVAPVTQLLLQTWDLEASECDEQCPWSVEMKLKCGLWFLLPRFNGFPFNNNQVFH